MRLQKYLTCGSGRCDDVCADLPCHFLQWSKLLLVDQIKLGYKIVEMLVAGVHVGLRSDTHDPVGREKYFVVISQKYFIITPVEMMHVHVYKHAIQTCQDLFALRLESFGKRNVSSDRKQLQLSQDQ